MLIFCHFVSYSHWNIELMKLHRMNLHKLAHQTDDIKNESISSLRKQLVGEKLKLKSTKIMKIMKITKCIFAYCTLHRHTNTHTIQVHRFLFFLSRENIHKPNSHYDYRLTDNMQYTICYERISIFTLNLRLAITISHASALRMQIIINWLVHSLHSVHTF